MAYFPPSLATPTALAGYSPPPRSQPVRLGASYQPPRIGNIRLGAFVPWAGALVVFCESAEAERVLATLAIDLPPDDLPLTFSALEGAPPSDVEGVLSIAMPPDDLALEAALQVVGIQSLALLAELGIEQLPLDFAAELEQDLDIGSDTGPSIWLRTSEAIRTAAALAVPAGEMLHSATAAEVRNQAATPIGSGIAATQSAMPRLARFAELLATDGIRLAGSTSLPATDTLRHARTSALPSADAAPLSSGAGLAHVERCYTRTRLRLPAQHGAPTSSSLSGHHQEARPTSARLLAPHTEAILPAPGKWWPRYTAPSLHAVLCCLTWPAQPGGQVILSWQYPICRAGGGTPQPPGQIIIPVRRVYAVLNSVSLIRVDTEQEVPASDLRLSLDASSWGWTWSATVPGYAQGLVYSAPGAPSVELLAAINGHEIRLRVDALRRSRRFGDSSLIASGLGRAAVLAAPTAANVTRSNDALRTAHQLLEDALTDNGVSIGWTVDWQLEDWSVLAGAWNHTGTYMDAATTLAEAGGGYVQGDDLDAMLHIIPWYPVAPWLWTTATPDLIVPEDVCALEGIDWTEKPSFDSVWVTGGIGGRRDRIKRAGTAGARQAPTVVDALATDPVMTRQRGTRVLADTGRQAEISLRLPVLAETGIIKPGRLVQYTESGNVRLGLTRGVSVEQRFPEVWQTVRIESHELE